MKEEVLGMSTLIGNLLELARTDNRQPLIRRETFDLSMLADWAAAGMTGRRNVRVINGSAGAVPVSADREMIRRLLLILLDNAVKYSPENSQVTVRVLKEDKGCRIEVEDQESGLTKKTFPIFSNAFTGRTKPAAGRRREPASGCPSPWKLRNVTAAALKSKARRERVPCLSCGCRTTDFLSIFC